MKNIHLKLLRKRTRIVERRRNKLKKTFRYILYISKSSNFLYAQFINLDKGTLASISSKLLKEDLVKSGSLIGKKISEINQKYGIDYSWHKINSKHINNFISGINEEKHK